eukprot:6198164-Pleurochrysis_carterae.AAC.1
MLSIRCLSFRAFLRLDSLACPLLHSSSSGGRLPWFTPEAASSVAPHSGQSGAAYLADSEPSLCSSSGGHLGDRGGGGGVGFGAGAGAGAAGDGDGDCDGAAVVVSPRNTWAQEPTQHLSMLSTHGLSVGGSKHTSSEAVGGSMYAVPEGREGGQGAAHGSLHGAGAAGAAGASGAAGAAGDCGVHESAEPPQLNVITQQEWLAAALLRRARTRI